MAELVIQPPDLAAVLKAKLANAVRDFCTSEPRTQQTSIGASELGNPCDRALALKSLGYGQGGSSRNDPLAAFIGTSVHERLEKVFHTANRLHASSETQDGNPLRYPFRIETRVQIAAAIGGTADLYDVETGTVIDHKVPADATMVKALKGDISQTYKVQIQCYGYGFAKLGYEVRNVAIAFWPRGTGATLSKLHIVTWPYDEAMVSAALERWYALTGAAIDLDLERFPERAALLATADAPCRWCPFFDFTGRAPAPTCKGHGK